MILAHMGFDMQRDNAAYFRQASKRATGTEDKIADAANIDDDPVFADAIELSGQLRDHNARPAIMVAFPRLRRLPA